MAIISMSKKDGEDENPVWDLFVEKLAPSHRKRAKVSADVPLFPIGCTAEKSGWYKYQYGISFPAGIVTMALSVLFWSGLIMYFTFVGENEFFSREAIEKVHAEGSEYDGNMVLFLVHNPKYLSPFMLGLANIYSA